MSIVFKLAFEYVDQSTGDTVRTEHAYNATTFLASTKQAEVLASRSKELHEKLIKALKDDGIIPPPSNVISVDFKSRKVLRGA